jgi:hypothetical protein
MLGVQAIRIMFAKANANANAEYPQNIIAAFSALSGSFTVTLNQVRSVQTDSIPTPMSVSVHVAAAGKSYPYLNPSQTHHPLYLTIWTSDRPIISRTRYHPLPKATRVHTFPAATLAPNKLSIKIERHECIAVAYRTLLV